MKHYSAFKKKGMLPSATAWMDMETLILNEISHSKKDK